MAYTFVYEFFQIPLSECPSSTIVYPFMWQSIQTGKLAVLAAILASIGFWGCNPFPPVNAQSELNLVVNPALPRQAPDCAQCHKYPLNDVHHGYHIYSINVNRDQFGDPKLNAMVTCMDCHFTSIQHFQYTRHDTTWMDAEGNQITHKTLPTDQIMGIESYQLYRPMPYEPVDTTRGRALADDLDSNMVHVFDVGKILHWMTGSTHNDGKVDVNFPPNNIVIPGALDTAYRPSDLSCSLVACHQVDERYRWVDPRKGLGQCPSLVGDNEHCFEPNDPRSVR